jgi:hypothetical protein
VPRRRQALHLNGEATVFVELFPLIASAMAVLCYLAIEAEESCE